MEAKHLGCYTHHTVTAHPPSADVIWSIPEQILQIHSVFKGTCSISQGLIKWSNLPASLATLEDLEHLRKQYPIHRLESAWRARGRGCYGSRY